MAGGGDVKTEQGTEAECKATIAMLAAESFKDHVLESEGEGRWVCRNPKTWAHGFRLIAGPGVIVVVGDSTDAILRPSDKDAVGWLRGAVDSPDYVLEKLSGDIREAYEAFYVGDAKLIVDELREQYKGAKGDVVEELDEMAEGLADGWEHQELSLAMYESHISDGWEHVSAACGFSPSAFWLVEELKTFVRLLAAEKAVAS